MRRRIKWFFWSVSNRLGGYAYGPVKRCRLCGHTAYPSDRRGDGCRFCPPDAEQESA